LFPFIPEDFDMLTQEFLSELRAAWLPNITEGGLRRLVELLERDSPFLIHGCFSRMVPMGCLATQIAWQHPQTAHLTQEAGITWLHQVAGLNPATSEVLRVWDSCGPHDRALREELLRLFRDELELRQTEPVRREPTRRPSLV
jgi:hypothetical protein